jgi:multidrug efflux pump subunit AcrB
LSRILFEGHREADEAKEENPGLVGRLNRRREHAFERLRAGYGRILELVLHHRVFALCMFGLLFAVSAVLPFIIGTDFFPTVDAGLMKLHVRAPIGTRLEDTEQLLMQVEGGFAKLSRPMKSIPLTISRDCPPLSISPMSPPTTSATWTLRS